MRADRALQRSHARVPGRDLLVTYIRSEAGRRLVEIEVGSTAAARRRVRLGLLVGARRRVAEEFARVMGPVVSGAIPSWPSRSAFVIREWPAEHPHRLSLTKPTGGRFAGVNGYAARVDQVRSDVTMIRSTTRRDLRRCRTGCPKRRSIPRGRRVRGRLLAGCTRRTSNVLAHASENDGDPATPSTHVSATTPHRQHESRRRVREGNRGTTLKPARPAHTPNTGSSDSHSRTRQHPTTNPRPCPHPVAEGTFHRQTSLLTNKATWPGTPTPEHEMLAAARRARLPCLLWSR
jgi:hypothetical protein